MQTRIVARLTAPVAAVSVLLVAVAVSAAWYARDSQRNVSVMLDNHVASVHAAQELEISLREIHVQFDRYLITGERKHLDSVPRLQQRAAEALEGAEKLATMDQEQVLMRRVRKGYEHFFAEYDRLEQAPPSQGVYAKVLELIDTVLAREILEPAREYLKINEGMLNRASEANRELSQRLTVGLVGLGVCGSVAGLLGGWVIAVSLRRSLLNTDRVLRDTAALLGEAAHVPAELPTTGPPGTTLQRVTHAAAAVLNRLKQTERDALRAEQLAWVGQMAAGIAHEVRNPLTVIKLLVQAATDPRRANGFRPQDLRVLEGEILRLEQIIRTFLDFARPPRPEKKPVEPGELIRSCLAGIGARAELQGVEIRTVLPPDLPALDADPGQLGQVFYNLLFNALDVLPSGGTIRITAIGSEDTLTVQVSDTGPGLPAGLEEQIFDPFISTKETGLGLGLSICRRIVEAHGGSIGAGNGPAGGAVFVVRLPSVARAPERTDALISAGAK
ncbi:Sporulation kinase A [Gemmata sp. SH-PL17]|uniref:sensor histidine kinase n=1 Tax=Gemmata sp. SH-PL17 TaxID=1630693 RepID=UPI00078D3543|nr:ATP-binding protein [Gemmata sp. SH-PL17]AMV27181.1 Sporulation kinase A [Gemmata sp. SH-PL17]